MHQNRDVKRGDASGLSGIRGARPADILFLNPGDEAGHQIVELLQPDNVLRRVETVSAMFAALAIYGADLLLLDRSGIPGEDVYEVCRVIRRTSAVAIVMLVDPDRGDARLRALEAGADDCFHRLLDPREMKARILGLLRRAALGGAALVSGHVLAFEGWSIDPMKRILTDPKGDPVDLTGAEFDLLLAFCRNHGRSLSRKMLLTYTSVGSARPMERSIDVHVSRLRAKLEADPRHPVYIRTVRLGGYVFTPMVELGVVRRDKPR